VDVPAIKAATAQYDVKIIEDCCQAHGAQWHGQRVGSLGHLACFSFSQGHIMSCGTGGAVLANDPALALAVRKLRFFGVADIEAISLDDDRDYDQLGFNLALNEFCAGLARLQLAVLEEMIDDRQQVVDIYATTLADIPELEFVDVTAPDQKISHHMFPVRVAKDAPFTRSEFMRALRANDVGFLVTYPRPLHHVTAAWNYLQSRYQTDLADLSIPIAEDYARRTVGIFCGGAIDEPRAAKIADTIRDVLKDLRSS
jgi:perosamine synthetase